MGKARIIIECEKLKNKYSGLGQFCLHLGHHIVEQNSHEVSFYLPKTEIGLFGSQVEYLRQRNIHKLVGVKTDSTKVFHSTHQTSKYQPSSNKTPVVLTVHDLNFLYKYKGKKVQSKLKELQAKVNRAAVITTISNFVSQELKQYIDLKGKQVHTIYNGITLQKGFTPQKPLFTITHPFFFTIGIIAPRKNFHTLLPMMRKLNEFQLVIAGNTESEYAKEMITQANNMGLRERVILCGNVSEAEKLWLYQHCEGFLFPSLAEGFGLPVAEAMFADKPVFLNNATSLPEVGGNKAYYWNNFDPDEMATVVRNGLDDFKNKFVPNYYQDQLIKFSWTLAASEYLKCYNSLL